MLAVRYVPKWRNWQTRMVQVHVLARVWGFESLLRHQFILRNEPPSGGSCRFRRQMVAKRLGCPWSQFATAKRPVYTCSFHHSYEIVCCAKRSA